MNCPICNTWNRDNAIYCAYCGQALNKDHIPVVDGENQTFWVLKVTYPFVEGMDARYWDGKRWGNIEAAFIANDPVEKELLDKALEYYNTIGDEIGTYSIVEVDIR